MNEITVGRLVNQCHGVRFMFGKGQGIQISTGWCHVTSDAGRIGKGLKEKVGRVVGVFSHGTRVIGRIHTPVFRIDPKHQCDLFPVVLDPMIEQALIAIGCIKIPFHPHVSSLKGHPSIGWNKGLSPTLHDIKFLVVIGQDGIPQGVQFLQMTWLRLEHKEASIGRFLDPGKDHIFLYHTFVRAQMKNIIQIAEWHHVRIHVQNTFVLHQIKNLKLEHLTRTEIKFWGWLSCCVVIHGCTLAGLVRGRIQILDATTQPIQPFHFVRGQARVWIIGGHLNVHHHILRRLVVSQIGNGHDHIVQKSSIGRSFQMTIHQ
mmetsp:Transcript_36344/g.75621  ORF Transcript_36344/g.75621 Transcript_36344/m.75621 type:complete len:316 (+) Transcript_36344:3564-4511(+)